MSAVGVEDMTRGRIPNWEAELWSYMSGGDGESCPAYAQCERRSKGDSCLSDSRKSLDKLIKSLDNGLSCLSGYDSVDNGKAGRIFVLLEMLAKKYREMGNVSSPPVPIALLGLYDKRRTVEVREVPLKVHHGAIWRLHDRWVIQLRTDDIGEWKRFTLFHEAFHILAHCKASPRFRKVGMEGGSFNELLADCFAMYTLLPRDWVQEKWAEVKDADKVAQIFNVSKPLMYFRLKHLGLT